tara:strand:+ start:891 stop:1469 length:579 start_codon:yes stop_codon:yes gene_type:complete
MSKTNDFIIARNPDYKVSSYLTSIKNKTEKDKVEIAESIKRRLIQRYILPCEEINNKSGFNIMANCCLLIETFESFYRGWSKTPNGSDTFCKFFNRIPNFIEFTGNDTPASFYKNIRCGILHQGETTGGWRIRRDKKKKLYLKDKIIDANHFRDDLKSSIVDYFDDLKTKDWSSNEWKMLEKKMKSIIKNCN